MNLKERDHEIAIGLAAGLTVRELVDKIGITDQAIRVRVKKLRPLIAEAFELKQSAA